MHIGNDGCGVAGKRLAARSDEHQLAAPAAHAGLWEFGVVVGDDELDAKFAGKAQLGILEELYGLQELLASGKKFFAIGKSPTVVLDVSKLDAGSGGRFREGEHFRELIEIAAVDDEIEREGDAAGFEPIEDAKFLLVRVSVGDFGGGFGPGALEAELEMIESGGDQGIQAGFVERDAGGDEIYIQAGRAGGFDEFNEIGASKWLAAGKIHLKYTGFLSFAENAGPLFGCEFKIAGCQLPRIRAVDTMERTAMGKFGDEGEGIGK